VKREMMSSIERMSAKQVLRAVDFWCGLHSEMIEEIGIGDGRVDGLVFPTCATGIGMNRNRDAKGNYRHFWTRAGFLGIEVKVSRQDFLSGLKRGQFEQYREQLSGLYLAVARGVCKASEIPDDVGLIVCYRPEGYGHVHAVCRRHPEFRDIPLDPDLYWRVMFKYAEQSRETARSRQDREREFEQKIGHVIASKIIRPAREEFGL